MKIKKGDNVQIMAGKDRGKTGKVLRVLLKTHMIAVEGVNIYKKHVRPKSEGAKGEIVKVARPLQASNVLLYCGSCGKGVRTGMRVDDRGNNKVRYCKKCQRPI